MYWIIKEKKHYKKHIDNNEKNLTNDKRIGILIILSIIFIYYIIGYIFKTDILNVITLRKNGISISFVGIILVFITSVLVIFIINFTNNTKKNK
jgi:Na+/H+-translocating membrane pyrophosphatase